MKEFMTNILQLSNPTEWNCEMWSFDECDVLKLRLYQPFRTGSIWVKIEDVLYFELPIMWEGGQFDIAPSNNCLSLLRTLRDKRLQELTPEQIASTYTLYTVSNGLQITGGNIRILGGKFSVVDKFSSKNDGGLD